MVGEEVLVICVLYSEPFSRKVKKWWARRLWRETWSTTFEFWPSNLV